MCALQVTFLDRFLSNRMLYRGALNLYSNLHTYDFGDAAPSVDNSPGHCHPFVRGKGGGGVCPSFEQRMKQKSLPVPGDTFALRGNGDF